MYRSDTPILVPIAELPPDTEISLWKRRVQFRVLGRKEIDECTATMELRTALTAHTNDGPGCFKLHFMEFRAFQHDSRVADPLVKEHRPHVWSLNAQRREGHTTEASCRPLKRIISFAISGDQSHVVTLTAAANRSFNLDLWDLRGLDTQLPTPDVATASSNQESTSGDTFSYPIPTASLNVHLPQLLVDSMLIDYKVSISWDASLVALMDGTEFIVKGVSDGKMTWESVFAIYEYNSDNNVASGSQSSATSLRAATNYQHIPELQGSSGYGKFHVIAPCNNPVNNEVFVTCDGGLVQVYNVHQQWSHQRTIKLTSFSIGRAQKLIRGLHPSCLSEARWLIESLRTQYLAWSGNPDNMVSIYDIKTGSIV
ncbi:hypothetical protein BGX26_005271 [Mortierella sp. AD094]|nr:hypothetical protein BGX26_005271 [Mortierella sp. AD094]